MHEIIKTLAKYFKIVKDRKTRESAINFGQLKIRLGFKIWLLRHGGLALRLNNYHRNALSSSALMITPMSQILAKKPVLLALEKRKFYLDFKKTLIITNKLIKRIQKKFIDKLFYREAKLEMLKLYWTQCLAWFVQKGCDKKDS